jgi:hypothetical protein
VRGERHPLLGGGAHVEGARVADRHRGDDGLPVSQRSAEVALHGCGQVIEFPGVVANSRLRRGHWTYWREYRKFCAQRRGLQGLVAA